MFIELEHNQNITDVAVQTASLQEAIDAVYNDGGGTVSIGPGCYIITTLFLRSGVDLHLQYGAKLQASHDIDSYPELNGDGMGSGVAAKHLIYAAGCENVTISGKGVIDGQDEAFWEPCKGVEDRLYGIFRFIPKDRLNPLMQFENCRNVTITGVSMVRSPAWTLHIYNCDTVYIHNITVRGHRYGPNVDGIGINSSRDVRISYCDVDTGDDAIIIKCSHGGLTCERVTVTNCVLSTNCAAVGIGAEVRGRINDIIFSNCVVNRSLRMIQIELWQPGSVQRVVFSGITGRTMPDEGIQNERPIYIDIQQHNRPEPVLGEVCDIIFRDILCESRGRVVMTAQDGASISGIVLDNIIVSVPEVEDPQEVVPGAVSGQLSNFNPETRAVRAAVVADNVKRLTLHNVEYRWPTDSSVPMHALYFRNVTDIIDNSPRLRSNDKSLEPYAST